MPSTRASFLAVLKAWDMSFSLPSWPYRHHGLWLSYCTRYRYVTGYTTDDVAIRAQPTDLGIQATPASIASLRACQCRRLRPAKRYLRRKGLAKLRCGRVITTSMMLHYGLLQVRNTVT